MKKNNRSSSGHKLGQLVGDWFEEEVATYLLEKVSLKLNLFLDHRFKVRSCRKRKIIWQDLDGNNVDYDFVLELYGTDEKKGIPVAFFETFWRRGARHSKDKARDDSGKLLPMRDTYPTARILGIISAGDFTNPAQELVKSRNIDLFYIPKVIILEAWKMSGIEMDYADSASESIKLKIANNAEKMLTKGKKKEIFKNLISIMGEAVFNSYIQRIIAGIASVPIEYKITTILKDSGMVFSKYEDAQKYLENTIHDNIDLGYTDMTRLFQYEAVFSDGNIFERDNLSSEEVLALHENVGYVAKYFSVHLSK